MANAAHPPAYNVTVLTMESARTLIGPGDIIENVYYMFWHPYVVESVLPSGGNEPDTHVTVRVVHYGRRDLLEGVSILQETLTLDINNVGNFRLYQFPEADCRPDEEVVGLARHRIGEAAHNILWNNNNATYFALSCKLTEEAFARYRPQIGRVRVYNPFAGWFN